jgi:hypothetical protein
LIYNYIKGSSPNLDKLEEDLLLSSICNTYEFFFWDEDSASLKVSLNRTLTLEERVLLYTMVSLV